MNVPTQIVSSAHAFMSFAVMLSLFGVTPAPASSADLLEPQVKVVFENPAKFTDLREEWGDSSMRNERHRDFVLSELKTYLRETARPLLQKGETLEIKVTDIDLAGDFEPWRGFQFSEIRVIKDLYPPRINLSYRLLSADGAVVREGQRHLKNFSFMMNRSLSSADTLHHEKDMLRSWIKEDLKQPFRSA